MEVVSLYSHEVLSVLLLRCDLIVRHIDHINIESLQFFSEPLNGTEVHIVHDWSQVDSDSVDDCSVSTMLLYMFTSFILPYSMKFHQFARQLSRAPLGHSPNSSSLSLMGIFCSCLAR